MYLAATPPGREAIDWEQRWIRWPDFWLPCRPDRARLILQEALHRCGTQRVEVGCPGGVGRTGTALAALAVLDGAGAREAVRLVRRQYHRRAVEVPWQRLFLTWCEDHHNRG